MNEMFKYFITGYAAGIVTAFIFAGACAAAKILGNRRTAAAAGNRAEEARGTCDELASSAERACDELEASAGRTGDILAAIRKQKENG